MVEMDHSQQHELQLNGVNEKELQCDGAQEPVHVD
jgi:hypothetical protein